MVLSSLSLTHSHAHINYSYCYKIYKNENYEYNNHKLISMSGHRFIVHDCTIININT